MFESLGRSIREEVVTILFHAQVQADDAEALAEQPAAPTNGNLSYDHESAAGADAIAAAGGVSSTAFASGGGSSTTTVVKGEHDNVGRNDPCWCGSGKKFKKCHGA
jgi:preprotein translocase subunit SecA